MKIIMEATERVVVLHYGEVILTDSEEVVNDLGSSRLIWERKLLNLKK